jgi:hypothetical protein
MKIDSPIKNGNRLMTDMVDDIDYYSHLSNANEEEKGGGVGGKRKLRKYSTPEKYRSWNKQNVRKYHHLQQTSSRRGGKKHQINLFEGAIVDDMVDRHTI